VIKLRTFGEFVAFLLLLIFMGIMLYVGIEAGRLEDASAKIADLPVKEIR
jgi:hypothetical protein